MNSIVVGSAHKYKWDQLEHWYKSLRLAGFDKDIYVLSYENEQRLDAHMESMGIIAQPCKLRAEQVVIGRFYDLAILAERLPENTWIISTDVSDIVFQYDPRKFLCNTNKDIVVASEGVLFKDNSWTKQNLADSFPEYWKVLHEKYYYNAGSFAAKAGVMKTLAMQVFQMCQNKANARNHDQAAFNILLQGEYNEKTLFTKPSDLWCYCAASSLYATKQDAMHYMDQMPLIKKGKCSVGRGKELTCMFHHYTRNEKMKKQVHDRVDLEWRKAKRKLSIASKIKSFFFGESI